MHLFAQTLGSIATSSRHDWLVGLAPILFIDQLTLSEWYGQYHAHLLSHQLSLVSIFFRLG